MTAPDMLATVDLGSNSFRLQICRHLNGQLQVVDAIKEMVRLAAGLDEQKNLDAASQQRALACLAKFGQRLRGFAPEQVRAVATNTFRVARNINAFMPQAEAALGFPIDIIAGREEARLIYTGVVHTLPPHDDAMLVIDIGGGSTEFVIGRGVQPAVTESLNLGCVTYSLRFFPKGKIDGNNFQAAVNAARAEIQRISTDLKAVGWDFAVGTSGSARSIRDVIEMGEEPIDGINEAQMRKIAARLIAAGSTKKARLEGLKPDRLDVFVGGLVVMMAAFEELSIKDMTVTEAALRDGVLYDMIGRQLGDDMRNQTVADFQQRYHVDQAHARRVADMADQALLDLVGSHLGERWGVWRQYVRWAADLHEIGISIAHTGYHKHAAYILEQADMPGFSRKEQHILATLVLGHRGDMRKMAEFSNEPMLWLAMLALRLASLFCRSRQAVVLPASTRLHYSTKQKRFVLTISAQWLSDNPLTTSALWQESMLWHKIGQQLRLETVSP